MTPMTPPSVHNTGEQAQLYQQTTLTGQYLLSAWAMREALAERSGPMDALIDFGCGGGKSLWPAAPFVAAGGRLIGMDVSPEMLRQADKNAAPLRRSRPDLSIQFCRAFKPPEDVGAALPPGAADVFHSSIVLQEIRDRPALDAIHRAAYRLLRPGGQALHLCVHDQIVCEDYVSFTYAPFPENRRRRDPFRKCRSVETGIVWENDRHWTRDELVASLATAGFTGIAARDVAPPAGLPPFPHAPWKAWRDERAVPPLMLVAGHKPKRTQGSAIVGLNMRPGAETLKP